MIRATILSSLLVLVACGPGARDNPGDDDDDGDDTSADASHCTATAATELSCNDGFDEDCDGFLDCFDVDCINRTEEGCPSNNCGELTHPESTPLALPDDGSGTNAYTNTIEVTGFATGQRLTDITKLLGICVTMEHTWLRDLEIDATSPDGTQVTLQMFLGQTGGEIYMGVPNDNDGVTPVPGTGWEYCWSPLATNAAMLDYVNANPVHDLPPGDYQAAGGWTPFQDTTLNGNWSIKVLDWWASDNGFIFDWTIKFDPSLVTDCSQWPTE